MIRNIIFMMTIIFLLCHLSASESLAQMNVKRQIKKGNLFYDKKQYEQALKEYNQALSADSESLIVNYNMGTALYKLEDYEIAKDHFRHGITSQDKQLAQKSFYNLANTQYYLGISKEDSSLPDAIRLLEESLRYYENAIMIDNKDEDAKYNYEFVKKEIDRLKEKLQNQQQKKDDNFKQDRQEKDKQPGAQDDESGDDKQKADKGDSVQSDDNTAYNADQQQNDSPDKEQGHIALGADKASDTQAPDMTGQTGMPDISYIDAKTLLDTYLRHEESGAMYSEKLQMQYKEIPVDKDW